MWSITSSTTSLRLTTFFISIDTTGKLGFGGEGDLHLASSDGVAPASALHVVAEASIDITGPAINLALYFTGAVEQRARDQRPDPEQPGDPVRRELRDAIPRCQRSASVRRSINCRRTWRNMLGIQTDQSEPMRLVVNIAPTKPIFEFTLGVADGHDFLKPVQPISADNANALTIDYASLVFAPLGGDVGPYHYEPGISVGFAGSAFGIDASGSARVTLVPPNIHADLDVGDIVLGTGAASATIKATHFLFDVSLDGIEVEASGGLAIAGGPVATVTFNVNATLLPPAASASFALDITNWNLPFPGASVRKLHATAAIEASTSSLPAGALGLDGVLRAGAVDVTADGNITLANGRVSAMAIRGSVSNFSIGGIAVSGPGCDGTGPQSGACVSAGFNPAQSPPLSMGLAGSVTVAGKGADISGSFGPTGVHATGSLDLSTLGNLAITGDLWFGSGLASVTALDGLGALATRTRRRFPIHRNSVARRSAGRILVGGRPRADRRDALDQGRRHSRGCSAPAGERDHRGDLERFHRGRPGRAAEPDRWLRAHPGPRRIVQFPDAVADQPTRLQLDRQPGHPTARCRSRVAGAQPRLVHVQATRVDRLTDHVLVRWKHQPCWPVGFAVGQRVDQPQLLPRLVHSRSPGSE